MKNIPDIEKFIEAARQRETDRRRQQQLSEMIDRLSAQEASQQETETTPSNRRHLWPYISVAASILLLSSVGLHILMRDNAPTSLPPIVAQNAPKDSIVVDAAPATTTNGTDIHIPAHSHHQIMTTAHNEVTNEKTPTDSQQVFPHADHTQFEAPISLPDESLLAEEVTTRPEIESNDNTNSKPTSTVVFERTSTRLVCGSGCRPEVRSKADAPQVALVTISGTGTTVDLGTISF